MGIQQTPDGTWQWTGPSVVGMNLEILDRMERAVAKVRERLLRATAALKQAGVPFAVVGGNAVASWVATVDEGAVRNTRDVDLLVHRNNLPAIIIALEGAGFVGGELPDGAKFRDGPEGKPGNAVHLHFSSKNIEFVNDSDGLPVIPLESLVTMSLMSHRVKDSLHIRDLIGVGLIDSSWLAKLPPELAVRLKAILDTPDA